MADQTLMEAMCCVMGLDGEICPRDSVLLLRLARHANLEDTLDEALERTSNDHEVYRQHLETLADDPETAIASALRVAAEEGELADEHRIAVRHLADRLGLDSTRTEDVLRGVRRELGLEP